MTDNLPIAKEQFLSGIIPFVKFYKRLPYLNEDDVIIEIKDDEKDEIIEKTYRAKRYIEAYFNNQDELTEYLFDNNIITYELISECTRQTPTVIKNIMDATTKKPDKTVRHIVELFFNKDFYKGKLSSYADMCDDCTQKCKHDYFVSVISCPKYKKSKKKK